MADLKGYRVWSQAIQDLWDMTSKLKSEIFYTLEDKGCNPKEYYDDTDAINALTEILEFKGEN